MTKRVNKLERPFFGDIFLENDIVLFTETWTSDFSELDVEGFECVSLHRTEKKKGSKRDSGGLVIYFRSIFSGGIFLVDKDGDDFIWLKMCSKFFGLDNDIYLNLCYVLPAGTTRQPMVGINVFDRLSLKISNIESESDTNCEYIITGDMNARTRDYLDMVEDDNCDYVPVPDDYTVDSVITRSSKDNIAPVNDNGWGLFNFCKSTGLRIMNGRHGNDNGKGEFTFVSSTGRSLVDYVVTSPTIFKNVSHFEVGSPNEHSDHCPVLFTLNINMHNTESEQHLVADCVEKHSDVNTRFVWRQEHANSFVSNLLDDDVQVHLKDICERLSADRLSQQVVDTAVNEFSNVLTKTAEPYFKKNTYTEV